MKTSHPLSNPTFRRFFAAQIVALVGTGLTTVALALLAYDLAGGSAGIVLGTILALKMVAYVIIAPIAGAFAQKLPRRSYLVTLDVLRAGFVLGLPFVTEIWQAYGLIFLVYACSAGFTPVFQATIPDILPAAQDGDDASYTKALSLSRLAYDLEALLSPALAAAALVLISFDGLFVINSIAFLASALLVLSVSVPSQRTEDMRGTIWSRLSFGTKAYLRTPRLRGVLALAFAVSAAGSMVIVNTVVLVREQWGGSETDTALALAASGGGSMLVALLLPRLLRHIPQRSLMLMAGVGLTLAVMSGVIQQGFGSLLFQWFALGMGLSAIQTPIGRTLTASSKPADRPALFSAHFALSHLCWLLFYPVAGWAITVAGADWTFTMLAMLCGGATLTAAFLWPKHDQAALPHAHHATDHHHLHTHDEHHQHDHEGWEGPEPHAHPHHHAAVKHAHPFTIDLHHQHWPRSSG